jgi:hypothetical protein
LFPNLAERRNKLLQCRYLLSYLILLLLLILFGGSISSAPFFRERGALRERERERERESS